MEALLAGKRTITAKAKVLNINVNIQMLLHDQRNLELKKKEYIFQQ
jgi:hypothetical protein